MEEITVEASRVDPYLPARTTIEREEILAAHDVELSATLERVAGLNVRAGGRAEPRVDLRGFDQRAILYTLNGVPVYEPYNGIVNVDLFPLEMLGRVEVVRGAASSLFGPNGMGGQVRLSTFGAATPTTAAGVTWREADSWDGRASAGGAHGGWSGFVAGRHLTSPNFTLSGDFDERPPEQRRGEDGGKRTNSDVERRSAFATLGYDFGGDGRAHVAVLASDATFGIPPSTTQFAPEFRRTNPQRLVHAQGGVERTITADVGVAAGIFHTAYDSHEDYYDPEDFQTLWYTAKSASDETGGIGRVTLQAGPADTLALGGQVRAVSADLSNTASGHLGAPRVTIGSVAAENVYTVSERIRVVLGASGDFLGGGGAATRAAFNPQGIVSIDAGRWGDTRLAVSRKIRFPTLRELFDPRQGNPDLRPETALTYEIGHRLRHAWAGGGVNLFRSEVDDLVAGGADETFDNVQHATLQGLEVTAGADPFEQVRLNLTYTYLHTSAHDESALGTRSSAIQHKPEHRFNGTLRIRLPWRLVLRTDGLYTASQLDQFGAVAENAPAVTVDGFGRWDAQLSRPVGAWMEAFAGADNLLDADYEQKLGTPEPGRRLFAGIRGTY